MAQARMASTKNNLLVLAVIRFDMFLYTCFASTLDAFRGKIIQNTHNSAPIGVF